MTRRGGAVALCAFVLLVGCSSGDADDGASDAEVQGRVVTTATTSTTEAGDDSGVTTSEPAAELSGTTWRLVELVTDEGDRQAADGSVPAVIGFDDARLEGYDGVDTAEGTYSTDGDSISIELDEVTQLGPAADPGAEQFLFVLLDEVDRFEIDDDGGLVLHHADGRLQFAPVGGDTAE